MTEPVDVITLAVALIGENALVRAGDTQYQLNEQNALNASIDTVVDLTVEVMNKKLEQFHPEASIHALAPKLLDTKTGVAERKIQVSPANQVTPELQTELLATIMMTLEEMIPAAGTLLSGPAAPALAPDKEAFVHEQISEQIQKHNGRKIKKPGVLALSLPGQKSLEIPVQGAFTPPPKLPADSSQPVEVLAKADGFKASSMQVFLRLVDEAGLTLMGASVICLADKSSQIQLAAQAFLDDNLLLKATIVGIEDKKGKKNGSQYNIKDLKTIPLDQLSKEGELQF